MDRQIATGYCHCRNGITIARAALHHWEEPCISGARGSGTIFFSGCTLRCCYCQNESISLRGYGRDISVDRLADIFLELQEQRAHNINFVTATPYVPWILKALDKVKGRLSIPVVYNCGGYESIETLRTLQGYVDVYLPDLKYRSSILSAQYSGAEDYFDVASEAIREMIVQTGGLVFNEEGLMTKGVIIRHLVLPGSRKDSLDILQWIGESLPRDKFLLSLMSQYTPVGESRFKELNRCVTSFEYQSVVQKAVELGLDNGYTQEKSSAAKEYTPSFDLSGV